MLQALLIMVSLINFSGRNPIERGIIVNDSLINTTISVDEKFIGTYHGRKNGYLKLNADGSGEYLYDLFIGNDSCRQDTIQMEWGFLLNEKKEVIKFERAYGYSYPILYQSLGKVSFQGCSQQIMLDYILEYNVEEFLTVSSSDDWIKEIPYQEVEKEAIEKAVESWFTH